jgi:hypothetical protein
MEEQAMTVDPSAILADPDWLPHACEAAADRITFVHVPRSARENLTFLSDEHFQGRFPKRDVPLEAVVRALAGIGSAPVHFIFHSSFACSTLLARALDIAGQAVSLREPDILLHFERAVARQNRTWMTPRLDAIVRSLARPYAAGEAVIVKPSNLANRLLMPILERDAQTKVILLYSGLPSLLRSLAKKGLWGRQFGRQLYRNLAGWTSLQLGYSPVETFDQTDLQIAGLAWLMHVHQFQETALRFGPERTMLLASGDLLSDVPRTIDRAARFLDLKLDDETIQAIAEGPVFKAHSKSNALFSNEQRHRDQLAADLAHGAEIEMVVKWISAVASHAGIRLPPEMLQS